MRRFDAGFAFATMAVMLSACGAAQSTASSETVPDSAVVSMLPEFFVVFASPVAADSEVAVSVGAVAPAGTTLTDGYPFTLEVRGQAGASPASLDLRARDAIARDDESITFSVPCAVGVAGDYAYTATLSYSVCTATQCLPGMAELSWVLSAE